jgi:IS5 family transposase
LPERLQTIDTLLDDDAFLLPFIKRSQQRIGRPTVPMECYLRLMFLKHERGLGYETLTAEVADSLTLRRFARLAISDAVPDASTLSRLTKRFGPETIEELNANLVSKLQERGFVKGERLRTDTTVIGAEVKHPTDAGLLADGVRVLSRTVDKLAKLGEKVGARLVGAYRDSTRTMKKTLWEIGRFLKKRVVAAGAELELATESVKDKKAELVREVNGLTAKAYEVAKRTITQARGVARSARRRAAHKPLAVRRRVARLAEELNGFADLTERVLHQTELRLRGQLSIPNRIVSIFDPDARPIRRGKLSTPTEFGYKQEITEVENGIISDYAVHVGNAADKTLLVGVVQRHQQQFGSAPKEVAVDRGYHSAANEKSLAEMGVQRISSPACGKLSHARHAHQQQEWFKRLQRWRAGSEGRISYLKRKFGGRRSRLRGQSGVSTWSGWGVLAHNLCRTTTLIVERAVRGKRSWPRGAAK